MKKLLLLLLLLPLWYITISNSKQETTKMPGTYIAPGVALDTQPQGVFNLNPVPNATGLVDSNGNNVTYNSDPATGANAGATSGGAGTSIDPALLNSYDQQIGNTNSALGRLGAQLNSGNQGIDTSYTNALDQLLLGENQAKSVYQDNKHQTGLDFVGAKNTIGANAGSSLSGLLRLLGSRGAGGSSAALLTGAGTARGAVGTAATQQRNDVTNTYGANNKALDSNWGNYEVGVNNQRSGVADQRDKSKQSLQDQIDNNRATLLQQLASLSGQRAAYAGGDPNAASQPYLDQANQIADRAANYTVAPINYQTQAYAAPELSKYTTNPNAAPTYQGQAPGNDYYSPYLAALLGKKQQTAGV